MIDNIKFPAITFAKKNVVAFARDLDDLTICSRRALRRGYYNGLSIIDSSGAHYRVISAREVDTIGFFFGFSLMFGQRLRVDIEIEEPCSSISIDELKKTLIKAINEDRYSWNSGGDLGRILQKIKESSNHSEIIGILTEKHFHYYAKNSQH
jgi:hypothetical protein